MRVRDPVNSRMSFFQWDRVSMPKFPDVFSFFNRIAYLRLNSRMLLLFNGTEYLRWSSRMLFFSGMEYPQPKFPDVFLFQWDSVSTFKVPDGVVYGATEYLRFSSRMLFFSEIEYLHQNSRMCCFSVGQSIKFPDVFFFYSARQLIFLFNCSFSLYFQQEKVFTPEFPNLCVLLQNKITEVTRCSLLLIRCHLTGRRSAASNRTRNNFLCFVWGFETSLMVIRGELLTQVIKRKSPTHNYIFSLQNGSFLDP